MKKEVHLMWNALKVFREYGFVSVRRRFVNKKFHRYPGMDVISGIHVVPQEVLELQRKHVFSQKIKFSILTPLYNTPEKYLTELIESLINQTYGNWELCLADGSDEKHQYVGDICKKYSKEDHRIVYKVLEENRGISENTNECIKLASGEYYGLLDHDDLLHPSALYEVMTAIEKYKADFIYTDEVKFSGNVENISDPKAFNFKPGFGKYDLRSHNYICHFTVFNKELLVGESRLYRPEFDGSQDHDMVLRLTEKANSIIHIPKVLYYWRLHEGSVSLDLGSKSYAVDAAIRAVKDQLARMGEKGNVKSNLPFQTIYKIEYSFPEKELISVVLHNANSSEEIYAAIENIVKNTKHRPLQFLYMGKEKIQVDNEKEISVKNISQIDFTSRGKEWNHLIQNADGDSIVLMDVKVKPVNKEWLDEMLMLSQKEDVCVVGPKIMYQDQTIAYGGGALWKDEKDGIKIIGKHDTIADIGYEALLCHVRNTTFALSVCMMFSKQDWEMLHGFSEKSSGYEDIEFCLSAITVKKHNVWTCFANLVYLRDDLGVMVTQEMSEVFKNNYKDLVEQETYYHPNWEKLGLV